MKTRITSTLLLSFCLSLLAANQIAFAQSSAPIKVYILSGQSNMVGFGAIGSPGETTAGTLEKIVNVDNQYPHLIDDTTGSWAVRDDVWYKGVISAKQDEWLTVGAGARDKFIGPELQFGHIMGDFHEEPVLIIKASQGNRSIGWDILPPGSERYTADGITYAGYGDGDSQWSESDPYTDTGTWYAGKQYDDFITETYNVLDNFDSNFPQWQGRGYEIAGFAWFQGHKDSFSKVYTDRYALNLANLIKAFRQDLDAPQAPFVIATIGFNGSDMSGNFLKIHSAQLSVSNNPDDYPEFVGNVITKDTRSFWRERNVSPSGQGYHYHHNVETYLQIGNVLGEGMVELIESASTDGLSIDDSLPAGAALHGNDLVARQWPWDNTIKKSGTRASHSSSRSGIHQHYLQNLNYPLKAGDRFSTWVYLGSGNQRPTSIQIQINDGSNWRRLHWGGTQPYAPSSLKGPLPASGQWVKLSASLSDFGISNTATIKGLAWTLRDGEAWWDKTLIGEDGELPSPSSVIFGKTDNSIEYRASTSAKQWYPIDFTAHSSMNKPVMLAQMQTANDDNTAAVRMKNLDQNSLMVKIEEETSKDSEIDHTAETIGYIGFEPGDIVNANGEIIGTAGTLRHHQNRYQWHTLSFGREFNDPIVIMDMNTFAGNQPTHMRLKNVGSNSAEYKMEEWDYLDGSHITETLSYIVVEAGRHQLSNGKILRASKLSVGNSWRLNFSFDGAGSDPVALSQAQTANNAHAVVTRMKQIAPVFYWVKVQKQESLQATPFEQETIGIISVGLGD